MLLAFTGALNKQAPYPDLYEAQVHRLNRNCAITDSTNPLGPSIFSLS